MRTNCFKDSGVRSALLGKRSVLKRDEFRQANFSIWELGSPAFEFNEMIRFYRLPDVERRRLKIQVNNPGLVAVVN